MEIFSVIDSNGESEITGTVESVVNSVGVVALFGESEFTGS